MNADLEKCENCGREIGKLEPALVWQGHVVCIQCRAKLNVVPTPAIPIAYPPIPPPPPPMDTRRARSVPPKDEGVSGVVVVGVLGIVGGLLAMFAAYVANETYLAESAQHIGQPKGSSAPFLFFIGIIAIVGGIAVLVGRAMLIEGFRESRKDRP